GEQPGMADPPFFKCVAGGGDQALADAAVPQIGADRQRPEKPDAAPARREIRAGERAILFGSEGGGVLGAETAVDEVAVGPEGRRVRRAEKRAEGGLEDQPRRR